MATKRQRRRREKERRHEYEIVYVDQEGHEVEVDEPEAEPKAKQVSGRKPAATPAKGSKGAAKAKPGARPERTVEPPSWNRTFRRAAIFVPIMLVFLYFARPKNASTVAIAFQAVVVVVVLIFFMYGMDSLLYRSYLKRLEKRGSPPKSK